MRARILTSQLLVLALVLGIAVTHSGWDESSKFVETLLFLLGMVLVSIGTIGRLWCSLYIAGYKDNTLVTDGPYSVTRNPLYFFSLIGGVGVGFATETFFFPLVILAMFAISYPATIRKEEEKLRLAHSGFADYFDRTPRFFPKWSLLKEPLEYVVKPVIFKKHMLDAMWFVWIAGLMEVIEALHEAGILPVLFTAY